MTGDTNEASIVTLSDLALYSAANDPQTGNDPQIGPQMIPNRKRSPMWTASDPAGKGRMAWSLVSRICFLIFVYVFIHLIIFFHQQCKLSFK